MGKKGKKKGGKKEADPHAGLSPEEVQKALAAAAERKRLDDALKLVKKDLEREGNDFNDYQQQREKLNYFWT